MISKGLATAALAVILTLGCGSEEAVDKADVARRVAEQWVQNSTEEVVTEAVEAVKEAPPVAEQLNRLPSLLVGTATGVPEEVITQQVRERLTVEWSDRRQPSHSGTARGVRLKPSNPNKA